MSSINHVAAMTALHTLNMTNKELITRDRVSTGLRVRTASDNAAYWSIGATMRSDRQALSTVQDALGFGGATVDIAVSGLNSSIEIATKIKAKLVAARAPGIDRAKIQREITQLQSSLQNTVNSASFSGENWLSVDSTRPTTKSLVASFARNATGGITIGTISVDIGPTGSMLVDSSGGGAGILDQSRTATSGSTYTVLTLDISALNNSTANSTDLEDIISGVDSAISSMTDAGELLVAAKSRIDLQKEFVSQLIDAIDTGIGQLVDAT